MEKNQILAALQIESDEVRLVIGEFYNDVLYIIAKESVSCKGLSGVRIEDENKVIEAIQKCSKLAEEKLSTPIEAVLLCIPGYRFKKEKRLFDRLLENKIVGVSDIKAILKDAYRVNVGNDYQIINISCANYKTNGIVYPKMPLNEKSEMLSAEVDLICGDKLTAYDYVAVVEKAGLKVIDIYQDGYASSAEAALFEQSFNKYVVNIHLEASHMVLSLIYNGRLIAGLSDQIGYDVLVKPIMKQLSLSFKDASRLLFRYGMIGQESGEERIINKWKNSDGIEQSVTYQDIQNCIYQPSLELVDNLYLFCSNILAKENVAVLLTGKGASLQNLQEVLSARFARSVQCYCPDTLGVRESKWTALVGMFYVYKDANVLNNKVENCVNMEDFKAHLIANKKVEVEEEKNITSKLRNITDRLFVEKE